MPDHTHAAPKPVREERQPPRKGVEEVHVTTEEEYFPPPRHLRELLATLDVFASVGLGAPPSGPEGFRDPTIAASDVLRELTPSESA